MSQYGYRHWTTELEKAQWLNHCFERRFDILSNATAPSLSVSGFALPAELIGAVQACKDPTAFNNSIYGWVCKTRRFEWIKKQILLRK